MHIFKKLIRVVARAVYATLEVLDWPRVPSTPRREDQP